jgi:hypothetical protein
VRRGETIATAVYAPVLGEGVTGLSVWTPVESVEPGKLGVVLASKPVHGAGAEASRDEGESVNGQPEIVKVPNLG